MTQNDAPKSEWIIGLPDGQPDKVALARIVDEDDARDDAKNSYYEDAADPDFVRMETAQRRFRGQYIRRIRRIANRDRHDPS